MSTEGDSAGAGDGGRVSIEESNGVMAVAAARGGAERRWSLAVPADGLELRRTAGEAAEFAGLNADAVEDDFVAALQGARRAPRAGAGGTREGAPQRPAYVGLEGDAPRLVRTRDGLTIINCVPRLVGAATVSDGDRTSGEFQLRVVHARGVEDLRLSVDDYSGDLQFRKALYQAVPTLQLNCSMVELRNAISVLSSDYKRSDATTAFGWTADRTAYLSPSVVVTAGGLSPPGAAGAPVVELSCSSKARHLDLMDLQPDELARVKRHIVEDLLALQRPGVTHAMLAAAALAVLGPFADGLGPPVIWLVGTTGVGKSALAQFFACFFGDFAPGLGRVVSWTATPNAIEHHGHYFKDALYVVDDYKPELERQNAALRVVQNYADRTGRDRLSRDASAAASRPIRGTLLSTGEDDIPSSASAAGRTVTLSLEARPQDAAAFARCVANCPKYRGVMADFIRYCLSEQRGAAFAGRVAGLAAELRSGAAGRGNDSRVCNNLAQLGAAFEVVAEYLADVWPDSAAEARRFISEELTRLRDDSLRAAREQLSIISLLEELAALLARGEARIVRAALTTDGPPNIVGWDVDAPAGLLGRRSPAVVALQMTAVLAIVNASLNRQGRAEIRASHSALYKQLREQGDLVGEDGQPLKPGDEPTSRLRVGRTQARVFMVRAARIGYASQAASPAVDAAPQE